MEKKEAVSAAKLLNDFLGAAIAESIASEERRAKDLVIRKLVESVPVDLNEVAGQINFMEKELELAISPDVYQNTFFLRWLAGLPAAHRAALESGIGEGKPMFLDLRDYVLGMGTKMKSVQSGLLCVAPTTIPVCAECYFEKICRLKRS